MYIPISILFFLQRQSILKKKFYLFLNNVQWNTNTYCWTHWKDTSNFLEVLNFSFDNSIVQNLLSKTTCNNFVNFGFLVLMGTKYMIEIPSAKIGKCIKVNTLQSLKALIGTTKSSHCDLNLIYSRNMILGWMHNRNGSILNCMKWTQCVEWAQYIYFRGDLRWAHPLLTFFWYYCLSTFVQHFSPIEKS